MRKHLFVILLGLLTPLLFLQAPGLGDDLTYWQLAFEIHEQGGEAFDASSFHDLRWPVWGLSWLLQGMGLTGLAAYYGVPMFYGALGAWLVFLFGRLAFRDDRPALAGALLFLFHPLLNAIIFRPMPDLSEGVLGAAAMWCWYALMTRESRRVLLAVATGALVAVMYSNRLTGLFMVPVLGVCTLIFFPRRWPWLALAGLAAAGVFAIEGLIYWNLTGDFLHSLHANLGARGRKGTESVALWSLPFRFFDSLWKGSPLSPVYVLAAAAGAVKMWRWGGRPGRVIVVWFVTIYLSYSCALQGINPVRPMLRDADRFLVGCAAPMALLAAAGLLWLWQFGASFNGAQRMAGWLRRHPGWATAGAIGLLVLLSGRSLMNPEHIPEFRRYVRSVEPGTKILTHHSMRALSFLLAPRHSTKLDWSTKHWIIEQSPSLEEMATEADEIWFTRKLAWLGVRKALERGESEGPVVYASYIAEPAQKWRLVELISRENSPDFAFWRRRESTGAAPAWQPLAEFFPDVAFPLVWEKGDGRHPEATVAIPPALRGQRLYLRLRGFSDNIEASAPQVEFRDEKKRKLREFLLKPYLHPEPAFDYFALEIPAEAVSAKIDFEMDGDTERAGLEDISLLLFPENTP